MGGADFQGIPGAFASSDILVGQYDYARIQMETPDPNLWSDQPGMNENYYWNKFQNLRSRFYVEIGGDVSKLYVE